MEANESIDNPVFWKLNTNKPIQCVASSTSVNLGEKMENSNYILRTGLNHRETCLFHRVLKYMDCVCR